MLEFPDMLQADDGITFTALPPSCGPCQHGIRLLFHTCHLQVVGTTEPWYGWLKEQLHQPLPRHPLWVPRRGKGAPDVSDRVVIPGFLWG